MKLEWNQKKIKIKLQEKQKINKKESKKAKQKCICYEN
jgi:hypothetical protein